MQRWWQEEERVGVNVVERVLKKAEYGERWAGESGDQTCPRHFICGDDITADLSFRPLLPLLGLQARQWCYWLERDTGEEVL